MRFRQAQGPGAVAGRTAQERRDDAAAAASVAAPHGTATSVTADDVTAMLALLDERRVNLAQQRVRLINQLHALLRDLVPGGAPAQLTAGQAAALLRTVRAAGAVEQTRKQLARDLIADVRAVDARIAANTKRTAE